MLPLAGFTVVFGLAFGVAAINHGMAGWEAMLMSAFMFAAPSQFAVLELWQSPLPLLAMATTTLAIHTRHILMSAALHPWLYTLPKRQRFAVIGLLTDSNWAMSLSAYQRGERNVGVLLGGGLALWAAWVIGTGMGLVWGEGIAEPRRYGLDVIMLCFLLVMVIGAGLRNSLYVPWLAAAVSAMLAYWYLPPYLHVMVGALTGGLVAVVQRPSSASGDR
ncbi:putative branched-subunit amino acid permease [Modicisalibacter xianhensis]|uniref:Putative branched-subunit amino acid permease n=1 Tax=Modicisalibacter xianhensis TaxID=442341 RepID=A0A4R8G9D8_9GAMM|nr:AzlC family ABC transporter permease [Halomonas xianhensis]TDX32122.1 putative branched-subunit amino acid permease [Halomonas xianhensis]